LVCRQVDHDRRVLGKSNGGMGLSSSYNILSEDLVTHSRTAYGLLTGKDPQSCYPHGISRMQYLHASVTSKRALVPANALTVAGHFIVLA
jgi:hypothetical protein